MISLNKISEGFFIFLFEYCPDVKLTYHQQLETKSKYMKHLNKKGLLVNLP